MEQLAGHRALVQVRLEIERRDQQLPLPRPGFEHRAQLVIAVEIVDHLDDRPEARRRLVQHEHRRPLGQFPPLPVAVAVGREPGQSGIPWVAKDPHRAGLLGEPAQRPEHREELHFHLGRRRDQQHFAALGQFLPRGLVQSARHHGAARRLRGRGLRVHPDVPVVARFGARQAKSDLQAAGAAHLRERKLDLAQRGDAPQRDLSGRKAPGAYYAPCIVLHRPFPHRAVERLLPVVRHLRLPAERLVVGPHEFREAQERHRLAEELPELGGIDDPLGIPEGIQQPDERFALPGEILQLEQLHTAEVRRAQRRLDILLIHQPGEPPGGRLERLRLIAHSALGQLLAKRLQVARLEHAGVFRDLLVARVHRPLPQLVRHQRHRRPLDRCREIVIRAARGRAEPRAVDAKPSGGARVGHVVVRRRPRHAPDVVSREGVQTARVGPLQLGYQLVHEREVSGQLVAQAQHGERRVVAVGFQDAKGLRAHELAERLVLAHLVGPHRQLDVQQEAGAVRRREGRFRRTPGMETEMVQPVGARNPEQPLPAPDRHRRVAGQREDVALQRSA